MASERLGEEVRQQGEGTAMTELVFNPRTGEFEQRPKGTTPVGNGEIVTDMTKGGFASI